MCAEFLPGSTQEECQKFADRVEETKEPLAGPGVDSIGRWLINRVKDVAEYVNSRICPLFRH